MASYYIKLPLSGGGVVVDPSAVRNVAAYTGSYTHTGTTSETLFSTLTIPANSFAQYDFFQYIARWYRPGTGLNSHTFKVKISNTNNFATAVQISTLSPSGTAIYNAIQRSFYFSPVGASNYLWGNFTSATTTDQSVVSVPMGQILLDPSAPIYVFLSMQLVSAADTVIFNGFKLTN
jgi:hypothetical protein